MIINYPKSHTWSSLLHVCGPKIKDLLIEKREDEEPPPCQFLLGRGVGLFAAGLARPFGSFHTHIGMLLVNSSVWPGVLFLDLSEDVWVC